MWAWDTAKYYLVLGSERTVTGQLFLRCMYYAFIQQFPWRGRGYTV